MRWRGAALSAGMIFAVVAATGCGAYLRTIRAYDGPARDDARIARLIVPWPAFLQELDGVPNRVQGSRYTVVELAPGGHRVAVIYRTVTAGYGYTLTRTSGPSRFEVVAEPGALYAVGTVVSGDRVGQYLDGPFPMSVEIPGTGRRVFLDRAPGSDENDTTDNFCFTVETGGERRSYESFLVPGQVPVYSEDRRHVAFFVYHGRGDHQWVVDGVPEKERFHALNGSLEFSADGSRYAYVGVRDRETILVLDGRTVTVDGLRVDGGAFAFSPDGKRFAYRARAEDGREYVSIDGRSLGPYQEAYVPSFSEKKGRLMFFAIEKGAWRLYFDGGMSPVPSDTEPPPVVIFDDAEERFAWIARIGNQVAVVSGGKRGPAFDDVSLPKFSPQGAHLVYLAKAGEHLMHVVVDGEIAASHPEIDLGSLELSESGDRVFFKVKGDGAWVMKELPLPQPIRSAAPADAPAPTASPDLPQQPS